MKQLFINILTVGLMGSALATDITLVKNGQPQCNIIIPAKPNAIAWYGAWDLQQQLLKITGAKVPVMFDDGKAAAGAGEDPNSIHAVSNGVQLIVGDSAASRALGVDAGDFHGEEYGVLFKSNAIVFIGQDQFFKDQSGLQFWGMSRTFCENIDLSWTRGSMNAVYDFLEKRCDVRWFHPYAAQDEFGSYFPHTNTLTVVAGDIRRKPVYPLRRSPFMVSWFGGNMHDQKIYDLRNKIGGNGFTVGHSFYGMTDRFWEKNPERPEVFECEHHDYFAQGYTNGPFDCWIKGPPQPCLTSTGFIAQVVKDAREFFDGKGLKYRSEAAGDMYGLGMNDNGWYCKCDNCLKLWDAKEHDKDGIFNGNAASLLYWTFVNTVAKEIKKSHPGKKVIGYAYFDVAAYPKGLELEDNVGVVYAYFDRSPSWPYGVDLAQYKEWVSHCRGRMPSVWLYPCFPEETASGQGWKVFWAMHGHHLSKTMQMLADDGVQGIMPCGSGEIVDQYLYAKLYDDPYQDIDVLLKDFFSKYFGPAAGAPLLKMYNQIESTYYNTNNYPGGRIRNDEEIHWGRLGNEKNMTQMQGYMDQAKKVAKTDYEKQHVAFWEDKIWRHMVEGRREYFNKLDVWAQANDAGSPKEGLGWADPALSTNGWFPISLPGRYDMFVQPYSNANGICWFRKTVSVTPTLAAKAAVLSLGPINDSDTVWVNGKRVGDTRGSWDKRIYQIPVGTLNAGKNVIAVRLYDGGPHGGFMADKKDMWLRPSGSSSGGINLAGEWIHKMGTTNYMGWGKF